MAAQVASAAIFVAAVALIATDRFDKTKVALGGAALVLVLGLISPSEAFGGSQLVPGIDWHTIFLLAGMMVIADALHHTGVFTWLILRCGLAAKGSPLRLMMLVCLLTAGVSFFIPNTVAVLLLAPPTIAITTRLRLDPVPYLICQVIAANIGGTATLVGAPTNAMIATVAGLNFSEFATHLGPPVVVTLAAFAVTLWLVFRSRLKSRYSDADLSAEFALREVKLLRWEIGVLGLVLFGFVLGNRLGLDAAAVAFCGAALMLIVARLNVRTAFAEVDWRSLLFFMGLFIMAGALSKSGLLMSIGHGLAAVGRGSPVGLSMALLWGSGAVSGVVENVPYVAATTGVVHDLARQGILQGDVNTLWWCLALGASLGGNATLIGGAANIVVAGIATRHGHPISFKRFLKYGLLLTGESLVICSAYVYLRYLR